MNMKLPRLTTPVLVALVFCLLTVPLAADIRLPAFFSDHMVVQQGVPLVLWGQASPGEAVSARLVPSGSSNNQQEAENTDAGSKNTIALSDGSWQLVLPPPTSSTNSSSGSYVLYVQGKNSIQIQDVLAGDVWLCSGQSNMEFPMQHSSDAATEVSAANDSKLRFFQVQRSAAWEPQAGLKGKWVLCTPTSVKGFSAVAYFFAKEIRAKIGVPVGLIASYVGGTSIQSWMNKDSLEAQPPFTKYLKQFETNYTSHHADNPEPDTVVPPVPPRTIQGIPISTPIVLYNAMIAPLGSLRLKGILWYQGESNAGSPASAAEYAELFPRLISSWRKQWQQPALPFLFVQLPNYQAKTNDPVQNTGWPWLRDAQYKTATLPATGMAVSIDLGEATNIHPTQKHEVGRRLALLALRDVYHQDVVATGPVLKNVVQDGNKLRVDFTQVEGRLYRQPPTDKNQAPAVSNAALPREEIQGIAICGPDGHWVKAHAMIEGQTLLAWADSVPSPRFIRYAWLNNPTASLWNSAGLPAAPFRNDTFLP